MQHSVARSAARRVTIVAVGVPVLAIIALGAQGASVNEVLAGTAVATGLALVVALAAFAATKRQPTASSEPHLNVQDRLTVGRAIARGAQVRDPRLAPAAVIAAQELQRSIRISVLGLAIALLGGLLASFGDSRGAGLDWKTVALLLGFTLLILQCIRAIQAGRAARRNTGLIDDPGQSPTET